jgi:hypothetical protein
LEQLVTSDLDENIVNEDMWATTCHLLRRCLLVRGLPPKPSSTSSNGAEIKTEEEYAMAVREFTAEDNLLNERRYVGGNAILIVGTLLSSDRYASAMGFQWRLFLMTGLGRGIQEWEYAASLLPEKNGKILEEGDMLPPDYRETALYGRKWMNHFLLKLASTKEVVQAPSNDNAKTNRYVAAQKLVIDETQRLLTCFLDAERAASQYRPKEPDEAMHGRLVALVIELLKGYSNMDSTHLKDMAWISPVLLSSCIQSRNEDIRQAVQKLVQLTSPASSAPPTKEPEAVENTSVPVALEADGGDLQEPPVADAEQEAEAKESAPAESVETEIAEESSE